MVHTIQHLLADSLAIIERVEQYCKQHNIRKISEDDNNVQSFTNKDNQYVLEGDHLVEVYKIILDLDNPNALANTLAKRPATLRNLLANVPEPTNIQHNIIFVSVLPKTRNWAP